MERNANRARVWNVPAPCYRSWNVTSWTIDRPAVLFAFSIGKQLSLTTKPVCPAVPGNRRGALGKIENRHNARRCTYRCALGFDTSIPDTMIITKYNETKNNENTVPGHNGRCVSSTRGRYAITYVYNTEAAAIYQGHGIGFYMPPPYRITRRLRLSRARVTALRR